jgi:hypothetical protein
MMLVIHRCDKNNTGDLATDPLQYWNIPHHTLDLDDTEFQEKLRFQDDTIIIGGGGLLNYCLPWNDNLNYALRFATEKRLKIYGWGLGYNRHMGDNTDLPALELYRFTSLGIRHRVEGCSLVPCASCMSELIQYKGATELNPGIIEHLGNLITDLPYPKISNNKTMAEITGFITAHNPIITNTYHGGYWTTLIGKSLILYKPFSERHYNQLGTYIETHNHKQVKVAIDHRKPQIPECLSKCRQINEQFLNAVTKGEKYAEN